MRQSISSEIQQFIRFGLVGVIGFFVDVGVLLTAMTWLGMGIYVTRIVSYLTAATTTWFLNRYFTFPEHRSDKFATEWLRFIMANSIGGAINYAVYAIYMTHTYVCGAQPIVGVALGSVSGLVANYALSRIVVFSTRHTSR